MSSCFSLSGTDLKTPVVLAASIPQKTQNFQQQISHHFQLKAKARFRGNTRPGHETCHHPLQPYLLQPCVRRRHRLYPRIHVPSPSLRHQIKVCEVRFPLSSTDLSFRNLLITFAGLTEAVPDEDSPPAPPLDYLRRSKSESVAAVASRRRDRDRRRVRERCISDFFSSFFMFV